MKPLSTLILTTAAIASLALHARAAEHITLRTGAEFDCTRHEPPGDRVRLYLAPTTAAAPSDENYIEVSAASVLRVDILPDRPTPAQAAVPQPSAIPDLLAHAGLQHNIDADLLASIVHAESNGNARAVSRAGAQGLMQLMPATASLLGVNNAFAPDQNISGGAAYLDQLLTRYHDNIRLAVAAYNAGPAAVDRYHGIPPFAETRAYVARVIREFNRRKREAVARVQSTPIRAPLAATLLTAHQ